MRALPIMPVDRQQTYLDRLLAFYGTFNRRCQQRSRSGTTRLPVTAGASMSSNTLREFSRYLVEQNFVTADVTSKLGFSEARGTERKLRDLWELTELSAGDFADEVARFYGLPRLSLPQLFAA